MIFFLYGPDDYRAKQKISELKQKFIKDVDATGASAVELSGDWEMKDWHEASAADSLFARRRLVLVRDVLGKKNKDIFEELSRQLDSAAATDHILIFYESRLTLNKKGDFALLDAEGKEKALTVGQKKLAAVLNKGISQHFGRLNNKELTAWISEKFAAAQLKVSYQAAQKILASGTDLWCLSGNVNKLIAYKRGQGTDLMISSDDVNLLVAGEVDQAIFAFLDAVSNRNRSLAARLLREQLDQGSEAAYLSSMMLWQIRILLQVREAMDKGETSGKIAARLKLHPYVCQKAVNQAGNFNLTDLRKFFDRLVALDAGMKSGLVNWLDEITGLIAAV